MFKLSLTLDGWGRFFLFVSLLNIILSLWFFSISRLLIFFERSYGVSCTSVACFFHTFRTNFIRSSCISKWYSLENTIFFHYTTVTIHELVTLQEFVAHEISAELMSHWPLCMSQVTRGEITSQRSTHSTVNQITC